MTHAPSDFLCDANAGVPVIAEVLATFIEVERSCPGNPASSHAPGRAAKAILEAARDRIATALGVDANDVLFTSGGTEAANMAVRGLGDPRLPVLLAPTEHPAVFEPAVARGAVQWSVDRSGIVQVQMPQRSVGLLCLVHAQSELGTLQPVSAAAAVAGTLRLPLFVDAAQSLGRVALDRVLQEADAVSLSPHKCGGLRGHGVLYVRDLADRLRPLTLGGFQEHGARPGTQNPALAAANALAIERAVQERVARAAAMASLRDALLHGLRTSGVAHEVLTPLDQSVPNTAMVHFPHVDGRNLLPALDLIGVHASHGSACSSGAPTPPRVLRAIGLDEAAARACVRFSVGWLEPVERAREVGERAGALIRARQEKICS